MGHCNYVNRFSSKPECRDYHGEWPDALADEDCTAQGGKVELGTSCGLNKVLGYCVLTQDQARQLFTRVSIPGEDAAACASSLRGCEFFGGGAFDAAPICGGIEDTIDVGGGLAKFQPPVLSCVDPKPRVAAGQERRRQGVHVGDDLRRDRGGP